MEEHPAFAEAGIEPGILIWTIDQFEPVPIEPQMYGKFYNGDAYIVLKKTGENNASLAYDAHFWLGQDSTQDKRGAAAILTVSLDAALSGRAVQHREVQGHESAAFLRYFNPAIRYLEGGLESGFKQVETNAGAEKRLLKLSGCDNMRISEVPADFASLNKENCFILEFEHDIFVLMPEGAKATHRRKIIQVANTLRDEYHNGRATIEIIDEFSDRQDLKRFFEALGSGSKDEIADDTDSEEFVRGGTTVYLYKILVGPDMELLAAKLTQQSLTSEDIFILDTPDAGVFIWIGSGVDDTQKKNYTDIAQNYLSMKGYPSWVHVTKVSEGAESNVFKQYFESWNTISLATQTRNYVAVNYDADTLAEPSTVKLIGKSAAASSYMPSNAEEDNVEITKFQAGEVEDKSEILNSEYKALYSTAVYVIKDKFTIESGEEIYAVYIWTGLDASAADKLAALELVQDLDEEIAESPLTVVKVPQGKEPKHFLSLFKGNLITLFGNQDEPDNTNHNYEDTKTRMFRVEGTSTGVDTRAAQVPENAQALEDDDAFVLEVGDKLFVRFGKDSEEIENEAAVEFTEKLSAGREVITFHQGEEPQEFWDALGGEPDDVLEEKSGWKKAVTRRAHGEYTLTAVNVKMNGKIQFEDLSTSYTQEELSDDGVYLLDAGEEIYLWRGRNVPERVKIALPRIIEEYTLDDGLDRTADTALVVSVRRGGEPPAFTRLFPDWDADMWDNQSSYDDMKNTVKAGNA